MPETVRNFCNMLGNQVKGSWSKEDYEVFHENFEWRIRLNTSEVGFVFSEFGEFKYCYNFKD